MPKSEKDAVYWVRKAAYQGFDAAQTAFAAVYEYGYCGVKKSLDEAIKWYKKAAAQGHAMAIKALKRLGER